MTLASLGNRPFKVLSATADGVGLSVKQVGDEFLVTQQCQVAGQQTGKVVFQVEAADGPGRDHGRHQEGVAGPPRQCEDAEDELEATIR